MELTEKEVSLLVDGLRCGIEKWQGMVYEALQTDGLNKHPLVGMLQEQVTRAEELKARLIDADVIEVTAVRSMP